MRSLTEADRKLCAIQASVFEESLRYAPGGSAVFVRRFMTSNIARRIDEGGFPFESSGIEQLFFELNQEFGGKQYGSVAYSPNELHWMGYLYRYWCCALNERSKAVYRIMGARELRDLYSPYHTLDPAQAIERILEAKSIAADARDIDRGVAALRAIRGL